MKAVEANNAAVWGLAPDTGRPEGGDAPRLRGVSTPLQGLALRVEEVTVEASAKEEG